MNRNTTTRDEHRRIISEGLDPSPYGPQPPCYHCGEPINYDAHHLDPLAFQIDHIIALANGGPDTLDNICPSHRQCNRAKSNKQAWRPEVTFMTHRDWRTPTATSH